MSDQVHVVPVDDLIEHDDSEDCICGPEPQMVEGGWMIVHQSLDGRKDDEPKEIWA